MPAHHGYLPKPKGFVRVSSGRQGRRGIGGLEGRTEGMVDA